MLTRKLATTGLLTCLLTAGAHGQSQFIPDKDATAGTCNVIPFGNVSQTDTTWSNQKYQTILTAAQLGFTTAGAGTICDLAFAPCSSGTRVFSTIEIKMDYVKGTTLSQTFSTNITASAVTVLKAANYEWHNTANQWDRIGLQRSFLYISALGNLCIEITVTGAGLIGGSGSAGYHRSSTVERRYAVGWTTASGPPALANNSTASLAAAKIEVLFGMNDLHTFGSGCVGSNSQTPVLSLSGSGQLGQSVGIDLSGALSNAPFYLNISPTTNQPPVSLTPFGAAGCHLYSPVTLLLAGACGNTGAFGLKVQIPNNQSLICQRAYAQYFPFDQKANPLGLTATNYGRILVGN